jgi:UPF0716 protein FxsA
MLLLLLFVVAPIVELYVIVQTSHAIGVLNTIGLIIVIAVLGSWLIKREGLKVWNRFIQQVQEGQVPTREIADGVCLLGAGALMLAPGFISDVIALLLLFPPTRALVRRRLMKRHKAGAFGRTRIIRATYGGPMPGSAHDTTTEATAREVRGELDQ